jgi:hypothetical protein
VNCASEVPVPRARGRADQRSAQIDGDFSFALSTIAGSACRSKSVKRRPGALSAAASARWRGVAFDVLRAAVTLLNDDPNAEKIW